MREGPHLEVDGQAGFGGDFLSAYLEYVVAFRPLLCRCLCEQV